MHSHILRIAVFHLKLAFWELRLKLKQWEMRFNCIVFRIKRLPINFSIKINNLFVVCFHFNVKLSWYRANEGGEGEEKIQFEKKVLKSEIFFSIFNVE